MTPRKILGILRTLFGFVLALGLVAWVVARSGIDPRQVLREVDHRFYLAAFLVYGFGFLSASWRWYLLLEHIKVRLPYLTVLRLALIGLFFNLFVPGGVGGDVIKMVYLKRESGDRYPQALLTVLLDRLLGLAGLLGCAVIAVALNTGMVTSGSAEMRGILGVVAVACLGGLFFGILFLIWPLLNRWSLNWGPVQALVQRVPPGALAILGKIAEALDLLRAAPLKLLGLLGLSTVGHLTAAIGVYLIALGVHAHAYLSFSECLLATQLSNLVAAVPLTPGGLGGRDLVMSLLLQSAGAPAAVAGSVPMMVSLLLVSWSLIGGLAMLWESKRKHDGPPTASAGIGSEPAKSER